MNEEELKGFVLKTVGECLSHEMRDVIDVREYGPPEAIDALMLAVAKARPNFGEIKKTKTGRSGNQEYKYAPLENLLEAVTKPLAAEGVTLWQPLSGPNRDGDNRITTWVRGHGAKIESAVEFEPAGDIKAFGSQCTYLRRYSLIAMLMLDADGDVDDGDHSMPNMGRRGRQEPPPMPERQAQGRRPQEPRQDPRQLPQERQPQSGGNGRASQQRPPERPTQGQGQARQERAPERQQAPRNQSPPPQQRREEPPRQERAPERPRSNPPPAREPFRGSSLLREPEPEVPWAPGQGQAHQEQPYDDGDRPTSELPPEAEDNASYDELYGKLYDKIDALGWGAARITQWVDEITGKAIDQVKSVSDMQKLIESANLHLAEMHQNNGLPR